MLVLNGAACKRQSECRPRLYSLAVYCLRVLTTIKGAARLFGYVMFAHDIPSSMHYPLCFASRLVAAAPSDNDGHYHGAQRAAEDKRRERP